MKHALLLIALLAAAPLAAAQGDSDYNTTAPADDSSYATDNGTPDNASAQSSDAAPSDADLNTSAPADDASYMADDGIPAAASISDATTTPDTGATTPTPTGAASTPAPATTSAPTKAAPGFDAIVLVAAGLAAALVIARRR